MPLPDTGVAVSALPVATSPDAIDLTGVQGGVTKKLPSTLLATQAELDAHAHTGTYGLLSKDPIKVQDAPYNVVADGVYRASATTQLQAALDLADSTGRAIDWGNGTIVTDTLTYRGQSMLGQGPLSIVRGRPSQDVFRFDSTLLAYSRDDCVIHDLTVQVDDSVNAAASFPNRGGVGNAGFACAFNDGAVARPLHWNRVSFDNLIVRSLSDTAQNNSCGFYMQHPLNLAKARGLFFRRLTYGWWDHYPTVNLTSVEHFSDHHHIDSVYFNGCTNPCRWVNWFNAKVSNYTQHGCANGPQVTAVVSSSRSTCAHIEFGTVMIEDVTTGNAWNVVGDNITVKNLWIAGPMGAPTIATSHSEYANVYISTLSGTNTNPVLNITGHRNVIDGLSISTPTGTYGYTTVNDTGRGNRVTITRQYANPRDRLPQSGTRDGRVLHSRDAASILLGHTSAPFVSGADLLVNPLTLVPGGLTEGTGYSYAADTAADLGVKMQVASPGGFFSAEANGDFGFVVGKMLPASKGRIYVKAKAGAAATQVWTLHSLSPTTVRGTATLSWTTAYAVQSFDYDLTGVADATGLQLTVDNLSVAGALDIAWVAFRPHHADLLVADATQAAILAGSTSAGSPMKAGYYYTSAHPDHATGTASVGYTYAVPVEIQRACTLNSISCEITTAGGAGAVVRLGLYADSAGFPGALLVDAGTVDATTTGIKEKAITQAVGVGRFWVVAVPQGATAPWRTAMGTIPAVAANNLSANVQPTGYRGDGTVTGALPATYTTAAVEQTNTPRLWVKAA